MTRKRRPSKYKPEYCDELIEYRANGGTYAGFAGKLRVAIQALYDWESRYPQFLEAKKIAQGAFDEFMDRIGANAMRGMIPGFNATVYVFTRKNCSGWRDNVEVKHEGEVTVNEGKKFQFLLPDEDQE